MTTPHDAPIAPPAPNSSNSPRSTHSSVHGVVAYVGLGSNVGDRLAMLRAAVRAIEEDPDITLDTTHGIASLYETSPVGKNLNQPDFLNSVIRISTTLAPHQLLHRLLEIERELGRRRDEPEGSRCIDLDLLLFGEEIIDQPDLRVPHPRLHLRRFVLVPLCEIGPEAIHTRLGCTIRSFARHSLTGSTQTICQVDTPSWVRMPH